MLASPMFLLNFLGLWDWMCKQWIPYFVVRFTVMYNEQMASKKRELFSNLKEFAGPSGGRLWQQGQVQVLSSWKQGDLY